MLSQQTIYFEFDLSLTKLQQRLNFFFLEVINVFSL